MRAVQLFATFCFALTGSLLADVSRGFGQYGPTQLFSLSQSGGQAGTSFDLHVVGGNQLVEIDSLHFSNPAITAELKSLDPLPFTEQQVPQYGHFVVTIPNELASGRYEVRAKGRHGISNPRALLISNLPNEAPSQVSHDATSPTPLKIGTLLHAKASIAEVDYYLVNIAEHQPLQLELLAQRLDSRIIGRLKLLDPHGREVGSARGADDFDPILRTTENLPAGNYLLAVHDLLYRGGDEYHYQLLARPVEEACSLVKPAPAAEGQLPEEWPTRAFAIQNLDSLDHEVPASDSPQPVAIPFVSTQCFADQQRDSIFQFSAKEGDLLGIDVVSQRVGEPSDARLIVSRIEQQESGVPKLHQVLNVDDCQSVSDGAINLISTDPVALLKVPATAQYQLAVRDLDVGQSLSRIQAFRLSVAPPQPGFDLLAYRVFPHSDVNQTQPFGSKLVRDGSELLRIFVVRRDGWNGAVKVRCEGLPPGVSSREVFIAANQSHAQMTLKASDSTTAAATPIRVIGASEDGAIEREAVAATIQWGKGEGRDFVQSRITSSLWISVSEQDTSPLSARLGDDTVVEAKKGESLKLPVQLIRREGGQGAVVVRPRDLPAGVKCRELTIAAEKSEGELEIQVESGAAPGTYSLWMQCETKMKWKSNPQELERAQQYRSLLQSLHDDPAQVANLDAIKAAIAEADKRVEAAKATANEKELTVFLPTSNANIRVVEP